MPPRQKIRYKTIIASSIIDNIEANDNAYIPPGLQKNYIPLFHLDSIDFNEDTADGKHTSHLLQLSVFQQKLKDAYTHKRSLWQIDLIIVYWIMYLGGPLFVKFGFISL